MHERHHDASFFLFPLLYTHAADLYVTLYNRFKALELVVKKVLSKTDAAEFLVAFEGIQDAIHQLSANQRLRKGPVTVSVKALGCS